MALSLPVRMPPTPLWTPPVAALAIVPTMTTATAMKATLSSFMG